MKKNQSVESITVVCGQSVSALQLLKLLVAVMLLSHSMTLLFAGERDRQDSSWGEWLNQFLLSLLAFCLGSAYFLKKPVTSTVERYIDAKPPIKLSIKRPFPSYISALTIPAISLIDATDRLISKKMLVFYNSALLGYEAARHSSFSVNALTDRGLLYFAYYIVQFLENSLFKAYTPHSLQKIENVLTDFSKLFETQGIIFKMLVVENSNTLLSMKIEDLNYRGMRVDKTLFINFLRDKCQQMGIKVLNTSQKNFFILQAEYHHDLRHGLNAFLTDAEEPIFLLMNTLTNGLRDLYNITLDQYIKIFLQALIDEYNGQKKSITMPSVIYKRVMPDQPTKILISKASLPMEFKHYPDQILQEPFAVINIMLTKEDLDLKNFITEELEKLQVGKNMPLKTVWRSDYNNQLIVPVINLKFWLQAAQKLNLKISVPATEFKIVAQQKRESKSALTTTMSFLDVWRRISRQRAFSSLYKQATDIKTTTTPSKTVITWQFDGQTISYDPDQKHSTIAPYSGENEKLKGSYFLFSLGKDRSLAFEEQNTFQNIVLNAHSKQSIRFIGSYNGRRVLKAWKQSSNYRIFGCDVMHNDQKLTPPLIFFFKPAKHSDFATKESLDRLCQSLTTTCEQQLKSSFTL